MSGLAGIIHLTGPPPARDQGHQLSSGVAHRGRDDKGTYSRGPAILVHRRFRCSTGETPQPLCTHDRVLVLDGRSMTAGWRIGPKLRGIRTRSAESSGWKFRFALWEEQTKTLWLARDATGTRPLFWSKQGSKIAFASEIPPLLGLPWISRELAMDHVAEYLSFRYVHAPRTLFRDVQEVPPGHIIRIREDGVRMERWWSPTWSPPGTPPPQDLMDVPDRLDMTLRRSVEKGCGPASCSRHLIEWRTRLFRHPLSCGTDHRTTDWSHLGLHRRTGR